VGNSETSSQNPVRGGVEAAASELEKAKVENVGLMQNKRWRQSNPPFASFKTLSKHPTY